MLDSWLQTVQVTGTADTVATVLVNLAVGIVLSALLAWHYVKYGRTYSNRRELAQVFPLIVLSTILIISLVSTNVALSLGLVGALSIVRFRTPIKEPEELAYLFAAIAMGIGLGAHQLAITIVAMAVILTVVTLRTRVLGQEADHNLFLNLEMVPSDGSPGSFHAVHSVLVASADSAKVRRLDVRDGALQATYSVQCHDSQHILDLMDGIQTALPEATVSFIEQQGIPAL